MAVGRQDARLPSQPHNDAPHKVCKLLSLSLLVQKGAGLGWLGLHWGGVECPCHNASRDCFA